MSRRRRAILLFGLALALGGLAASDVARRESAIARQLGPAVPVVAARVELPAGTRIGASHLTVRRVPSRYAPAGAVGSIEELVGARIAAGVAAGGYLTAAQLGEGAGAAPPGPRIRVGERIAEVVAAGSGDAIHPGARVDVLVTREPYRGAPGQTVLALQDVEAVAVSAAGAAGGANADAGAARLRASLRVTLRQAVYLAAAQSFARELRLLPRAPGDRRHVGAGLAVDATLG